MTLELCKRLLKHYKDSGNVKAASNMMQNMKAKGFETTVPPSHPPKPTLFKKKVK